MPVDIKQYYWHDNRCMAPDADHPDCRCWWDEGTGPQLYRVESDGRAPHLKWRASPINSYPPQPVPLPVTTQRTSEAMLPRLSSCQAAVVAPTNKWIPITAATPVGVVMQLISKPAGRSITSVRRLTDTHWTHWYPVPTFDD